MDITSSIACTSMSLSECKVRQAVEVAMLKKTMELQELEVEYLIEKMPEVTPSSGNLIDTKA